MKTKFKKIIALCIATFGLHSCNDIYDAINLDEANSRIIATSQMNFDNTIRVGTSITLGDLSSGVQSRLWTFPEGVADIVDSDNDVTTTTANVKAIFNTVGTHNVKLHQEFKEEAYDFKYTNKIGKVVDTTLVITVLPQIKVTVTANYLNSDGTLGAPLNMADGAKNQVIASRTIRYTLTTEGAPEKYLWTIPGGTPETSVETSKTLDVKYKKLGTYGFSINGSTARPAGSGTTVFTELIQVIPSTDPVTLDGAQVSNNTIRLNFSREMDQSSLKTTDFTASVTHPTKSVPSHTISSVSVDPTEGNIVVIKFLSGQNLYNDDVVKISYTKGSMTTADGVAASSFANLPVSFAGENLLSKSPSTYDAGFETSTNANWKYLGWGAPWDKYTLNISGAKAHSGSKSAYIEIQPAGGMIMGHFNNSNTLVTFNLVAGKTYEMGCWTYVESLGSKTSTPDLRFYLSPNTDWGIGPNPGFSPTFTVGKWVYSSTLVKINATANYNFMIRGDNAANSQALKFYLDDITVTEAVLRP
ncbi:hypothetical protein [Flavobacterium sp. UMI-01]|uniref:hypothetical protein n=1 Tax=Flavobacterium sp. UMI-01 TaxID=1441053 RepID=UPI001C7CAB9C|nr:hypothetical protein [Flavobacterium sp. UMI-01]GIZ09550.1 hypothetical protein FUMI01_22770 [Flavobacterium sp. UMI-01]